MKGFKLSNTLADAITHSLHIATRNRDEFLTPEHLLWAIAWQPQFAMVIGGHGTIDLLMDFLEKAQEAVPEHIDYKGPEESLQYEALCNIAVAIMESSGAKAVTVPHVIRAIFELEESYAAKVLRAYAGDDPASFFSQIIDNYADDRVYVDDSSQTLEDEDTDSENVFKNEAMQYLTCLNDHVADHNPLIGREKELNRTIQVLCRKDKNNPLHVGEPGVGKTAIAYGLAARICSGDVPERLRGVKVYELDLGCLIAGTQYRGDFEKRLKLVLDFLTGQSDAILYVDEIHNLIGAGRVEGSTMDASNLLKRHLEQGTIRFMGSTTFDEYNRTFARNKGFSRRFEKIDINEPSLDECREILRGLKGSYEEFHGVTYTPEAIDYAVVSADKYITGKFLPDKAIDLIDEAGAYRELHPVELSADASTPPPFNPHGNPANIVDRDLIADTLAKVCHVETLADKRDESQQLQHLEERIKAQVYGQDHAIRQLTEAVLMGSAGLIDDNKPIASLLFVGPTGVGKTEVARVLASELHLPLLRFDMSEYAEKHTVAKLIGSPAGYVGYEDGGLLTDAIRKNPHCVLLFDELEKAHEDIYNILLQVMDYAVLTDNHGQKADFRHVIFIMTTNSGAQYAHQANLGFVKGRSAGEAMMKSVKKTFKPEFINRLTDITIFNDMDRTMASLILDKKLNALRRQLKAKDVTLNLSDSAMEWLLNEGFSAEYGGREVERVINSNLKPLLMREILFGALKGGGSAEVTLSDDGKLIILQDK